MNALKVKIFDVLLEIITVLEFENWLYDSEEILENIESNTFYFDVITINYRNNTWYKDLNILAVDSSSENYYKISETKRICSCIIKSKTFIEA